MDDRTDSSGATRGVSAKESMGSSSLGLLGAEVLIADADAAHRGTLSLLLRQNGWRCREAHDADAARDRLRQASPSLILLDWQLPHVTGLGYLHQLKRDRRTSGIPVIIMSARASEQDKVTGLDSGADDYITKPIPLRELVARMQAILRRVGRMGDTRCALSLAGLTLDPTSHRVLANGLNCALGPTEFKLLECFMSQIGRVHSRQQLRRLVWAQPESIQERTVDVYVRRLRHALHPFGYDRFVQTVHGAGYRFCETERPGRSA
ncbi:response regulator [Steroidobacter sp. S1-65]|uniref:Response regulator n=1 Tax=Steroidobacter gossypii TaxID=2805490 RepID=A0ABS1WZC1_9GAMM|nr:response regulator [Steroidobacter gossypii]MBM0106325.1 response regulator [Steroidobacter gossypii]